MPQNVSAVSAPPVRSTKATRSAARVVREHRTVQRRRHLAKAVFYRFYSSGITAGITYAFTSEVHLALGVSITECFVKIFSYYAHERVWYRFISWGVAGRSAPAAS